ncbi:MAG: exodeoxyribonuclease V subunit beta [Desulfuromonadaceae bacterium]|nr:exodeoxyribonuclease V subunit beta [Desulfuromonadaceae bacterium]
MRELDHLNIELSGRNLIEASAGTGKTYAIACLYLRILIEQDLTPEQILVVTYTEAATEELRGRIRSRIKEALEVFSGTGTKDDFLLGLHENCNGKGPTPSKAKDILMRALYSFDTASIFTIHGFCLRALQDNAFESGSLYDTELVTDQAALLQEIVDDFWRIHFFAESSPFLVYALGKRLSPDYFFNFIKGMANNPKLEIIPSFSGEKIATIEQSCRECFAAVREEWHKSRGTIIDILTTDKGLSRAVGNYPPGDVPDMATQMDIFVAGDNPFALGSGFVRFSSSGIAQGKKEKGAAPAHPFFDLCQMLLVSVEQRFLALKWELVSFVRERLPVRKREMNIRFFDDLMTDLYDALSSPGGDTYAESLRGKFRAALIDEFQDTDPVQYDIFRKIYTDPACPLFLIGDPKQAIYSFRGADIFAYLEAAADVDRERRFTLTANWRSTPQLLAAFNTIFSNDGKPFVFDEIIYHPVTSGRVEDGKQLVSPDRDEAPLQMWYLPVSEDGKPVNVGTANAVIPAAVAGEIGRLLQDGLDGTAFIGDRALLPGDIAVIVPSHRQAGYIQSALRDAGIPSVMRSDKSIFSTDEARDVCTLLAACADPGNETKIRTALVTDILGKNGNDIAGLIEDEQCWEAYLERFRAYHHLWVERGFMVMSHAFLEREGVRGRLLSRVDGDRRLTNLLHCFEVIHHAAHERGLGIEGLLVWFGERVSGGEEDQQYQIRLETDEKMVKIVTVHVSKGLEYPVVFCPFMWGGLKGNREVVTFHDSFTMVKDFGSADIETHRVRAQQESLAESLRLLYVAVTRAKYRCYLLGGKIVGRKGVNEPETSPLSYLLHASDTVKSSDRLVRQLALEVGALSAGQMEEQLRRIAADGGGAVSAAELPEAPESPQYMPPRDDGAQLASREFTRIMASDWRVASFTSFTAHGNRSIELPDRDETGSGGMTAGVTLMEEKPEGKTVFTFHKGAQAGIFLHSLFEELDFSDSRDEAVRVMVEKGLEKAGYDREWQPCISELVTNVISTPLNSPEGSFTLAELKRGRWLAELEFFFPLRFITSPELKDLLGKWGGGDGAADLSQLSTVLSFTPVRGMVRGFMDMIFEHGGRYYLVDWKSNHLGYRVEAYDQDALKREMVKNLYPLQYLLYTVALNRYLSLRVNDYAYERHFGGVLYFFLRGMKPGNGEKYGVFRDLPPVGLIRELTAFLVQVGG